MQWQWPNDGDFKKITPAPTKEQRSTKYFAELLDLLCNPPRKFEHYYAIDAMSGMSCALGQDDWRQLCKRVCDNVNCQPKAENQSKEWSDFVTHICGRRFSEEQE